MTPEAKATKTVRERASAWKMRLFRNNSGVLNDERGVPVRFGLGNESKRLNQELKSSDLIGWTPITITPDMVGKTVAVFTAIEVKSPGFRVRQFNKKSREYAQNKYIELVKLFGGIAGFAADWPDVDKAIKEWKER